MSTVWICLLDLGRACGDLFGLLFFYFFFRLHLDLLPHASQRQTLAAARLAGVAVQRSSAWPIVDPPTFGNTLRLSTPHSFLELLYILLRGWILIGLNYSAMHYLAAAANGKFRS